MGMTGSGSEQNLQRLAWMRLMMTMRCDGKLPLARITSLYAPWLTVISRMVHTLLQDLLK